MTTQLLIQAILIAVTLVILWRVLRSTGQRTQALRRIGFVLLGAFAILSILLPGLWGSLATLVGVGRGTDLILYALVAAFFSFVVTSYRRFRDLETRYTRLARRIALDEAARDDEISARQADDGA